MKSRKSGMFAKRSSSRRAVALKNKQRTLRRGLLEKLEDRNLMASDWNPAFVGQMGYFVTPEAKAATVAYVQQRAGGALAGTGAGESDVAEVGAEGFPLVFKPSMRLRITTDLTTLSLCPWGPSRE